MNSLALCALLVGIPPEPDIDPTFGPKLKWTVPAVGGAKVPDAWVVAISADGTLVAGIFDRHDLERCEVVVYDRKTGAELHRKTDTKKYYSPDSLRFSRDNRFLAVGTRRIGGPEVTEERILALEDLKEKKCVKTWADREDAFSPVADLLYLTTETNIEVISLPNLKTVKTIDVPHVTQLEVSADGKTIAALYDHLPSDMDRWQRDRVVVLDAASGAAVVRYEGFPEPTHASLALSPDGKRVATCHWRGEARVWSAVKEEKPQRLKVQTSYKLSPLWLDNDTLGLFLPVGEDGRKEQNWTDMYRCDLSKAEPEAVRWRFENSPAGRSNTGRFALTAERRVMVAACNGMSVIDLDARKVERTFTGSKELPKK